MPFIHILVSACRFSNKYVVHLGLQPADIFEGVNDCNVSLYLTTKHVFENFGGIRPVAPWLRACFHVHVTVQASSGNVTAI